MNVMNTLRGGNYDIAERKLVDKHGRSRAGNYMHMVKGGKFFPMDPRADEIDIEEIAHHLANNGRWAGATQHKRFKSRIFYSVAEHSVYVARHLEKMGRPDLALEGLLHDGPEYVIGDLIRPMKYHPAFKEYFKIEELNDKALAERFNLVYPFPKEIKLADEAITEAEHKQIILRNLDEEWSSGLLHDQTKGAAVEIQMLDPYPAKEFFLQAYYEIIATRETYRALPPDFRL
jgi:hypothetical protein